MHKLICLAGLKLCLSKVDCSIVIASSCSGAMNGPGNVSLSGELSGLSQKYKTHPTLQLNGAGDGQIKQNLKT